jgi:hypothetical protein
LRSTVGGRMRFSILLSLLHLPVRFLSAVAFITITLPPFSLFPHLLLLPQFPGFRAQSQRCLV